MAQCLAWGIHSVLGAGWRPGVDRECAVSVLPIVHDSKSLLNGYPMASGGLDEGTGRHMEKGGTPTFSELVLQQGLSPEQHMAVRES